MANTERTIEAINNKISDINHFNGDLGLLQHKLTLAFHFVNDMLMMEMISREVYSEKIDQIGILGEKLIKEFNVYSLK